MVMQHVLDFSLFKEDIVPFSVSNKSHGLDAAANVAFDEFKVGNGVTNKHVNLMQDHK